MATIAEPTAAHSVHKRRVNDLIFESLRDRMEEPIAFFCECSSPRCFETVWMTAEEYEDARKGPRRRARSPGH
jgi:hypothetical protein